MKNGFLSNRTFIMVTGILAIPVIVMMLMSFLKTNNENAYSLDGFHELFTILRIDELVKIAGRAFVVASIATTIAFTVSWLLVQYTTEKFQTLFLVVITLPFLINESIRIFSWQYFLAENGLINRFLSFVSGYDVRLMNGSNSWNIYVVMIIACIPFGVFICAATLKTIPHIFWKSASDLKLSEMSKLLKIGLPLSKFAIATSLIILFFIAFSMSSEVNFLGGDTKISTRNFVLSLMSAGKFQAIFALGFFIVLLVLLIYLGGLFYTKKKNK